MKFMQTKKDMIEPKMFVKWVKEWELTNHSFVKQLKQKDVGLANFENMPRKIQTQYDDMILKIMLRCFNNIWNISWKLLKKIITF